MRSRRLIGIALCLLSLPCLGFDWPGGVYRLERELAHADPAQRSALIGRFAQYPAAEIKEPLLRALEDDDPDARHKAASVAGRVRLREAVPILLDWLDDKDVETRRAAAAALGGIGEGRAVPALTRSLGDTSAEVRRDAVIALGRIGGADVVAPLLGRLDDVDIGVRGEAIAALAAQRDERAVTPLLAPAGEPSAELRAEALRALGALGDARALPVLSRALEDADEDVHLSAAAALGQIGDASAVRALAASLARDDARLSQGALAALGRIDDAAARTALIAALATPALRRPATSALVAQAELLVRRARPAELAALVSAVAELLRSPDAGPRLAAADALARLAEVASIDAAVPALLASLPAADDAAAPAWLRALALSASPDALLPLLERLGQAKAEQLTPVLDALGAYFDRAAPDGRAADPLLGRLAAVSAAQRVAIVDLLARVAAPRALPALLPLIASDDHALRLSAIRAAGAIGSAEANAALVPVLDARDAAERFEAARALRATATPEVVQALLARLSSNEPADRHALLIAIGGALARLSQQGQVPAPLAKGARAALAALIAGDDFALADRALDALAVWRPEKAIEVLAIGLRSPSSNRRAVATQALSQLDEPGTREMLRYVLHRGSARESAAAAAGLAELGGERDVPALLKVARRTHWPVPGTAAYALSRIAARGAWKPHSARRALCDLGRSREPYVRANVAAALAALGAPACDGEGTPDPLVWLGPEHAAVVRRAAARWVHAAAAQSRIAPTAARTALERCAATDVEASVRAACAAPPAAVRGYDPADVYAYARDGSTLLRNALVAIESADGTVYLGRTDHNGHVRLRSAARGALELEDPGLAPLEPATTPAAAAAPSAPAAP
jgi:HEAT repeat protein